VLTSGVRIAAPSDYLDEINRQYKESGPGSLRATATSPELHDRFRLINRVVIERDEAAVRDGNTMGSARGAQHFFVLRSDTIRPRRLAALVSAACVPKDCSCPGAE
jgi:hypothetical protein